tara:strand:+ start:1002 stop:2663 length:1662 start_codon:yes stop_codon:yes gene_type:complete
LIVGLVVSFSKFRKHRAEWGTGLARRVRRKAGWKFVRLNLRPSLGSIINIKNKSKSVLARLRAAAKRKGEKTEPERKTEKGIVKGAEAAEETETSAEALIAAGSRAADLIAGLTLIQQAIDNYVRRESYEENKEKLELKYIDDLIDNVKKTINYNELDSNLLYYLKRFLICLLKYLRYETEIEGEKKEYMKTLIQKLRVAIAEIKEVLREARTESKIFKKFERKTRKDYGKEISKIKWSIWGRRVKLLVEIMKFKKADKALIKQLKQQIAELAKRYNDVKKLHKRLKRIFRMMDKGAKKLGEIIKSLLKSEKKMYRFDRPLNRTEPKIDKKHEQMKSSFAKLEESVKTFKSTNDVHDFALPLSTGLNEYLEENKELSVMSSDFDKAVRDIVQIGFLIAKLTVTYEKIMEGLLESEKTVDQGMELLESLMEAITSESEVKSDDEEVSKMLEKLDVVLTYEKNIEEYMFKLTLELESRLNGLYDLMNELIEEDARVVDSVRRSSMNFVSMMGVVHERLMTVGGDEYMGKIRQFEETLGEQKSAISGAYSQARRFR